MRLRGLLLSATVLAAAPMAAWAQPVDGLYVGGGAGATWLQQETLKSVTLGPGITVPIGTSNKGKVDFSSPGFVGVLSGGYGFGNGLRLELEGGYRENSLHKATAFGGTLTGNSGQEQKYGPMVNAFYDFQVSPFFTPYLGIGAGYQFVDWNNISLSNATATYRVNSTKGGFAFQPILGAAFPIPAVPGLAFTVEYRFMDVIGNLGFKGTVTSATGTSKAVINTTDNYNHSVLLGVRYAFGVAPPPAPAPMAAPVVTPAHSYLVFFDWDKATLTTRARQIIAEAAANIPKVQHTQIEVNGYTDTSGTPKYNQGLSIRRAQAVAAELVRLGVAKSEIAIQGFGETHLLVPTAAGVREPQNRRVEIIIK